MLLEETLIADLEFVKFEAGGDRTTDQAMALCVLALSGKPSPSRHHYLEMRALMPQWMSKSKNAEAPTGFQDVDSNWRAVIKMPHLV